MLYGIAAALVMLWLLDNSLRHQRIRVLETETRFELFAIRDRLRNEAIQGAANDKWMFDYLDTTLTRMTEDVHQINLWHAIALIAGHSKNEKMKEKVSKLKHELQRPANKFYSDIFEAYSATMAMYLFRRHNVLIGSVGYTAKVVGGLLHWSDKQRDKIILTFGSAPETSTLMHYCN